MSKQKDGPGRPSEPDVSGFSGVQLRTLREGAGLSRTALAAAVGREYGAVEAWERGASEPSLPSAVSLMRVLGCSFEDICCANADDPPRKGGPSKNASGGTRNASTA